MPLRMVRRTAANLNGISVAYVMGVANALFDVLLSFGVSLDDHEIASIQALLNAMLIAAVHFGHRVGEASVTGSSTTRTLQAAAESDAESAGE